MASLSSSWSDTRKFKVAAASIATVVGIGLSVMFYQRIRNSPQKKRKSKRKTKTEPKVTKEKLIGVIASITHMMGQTMPQLVNMQTTLVKKNVPEDQRSELLNMKFEEVLKQAEAYAYSQTDFTQADVEKSHSVYKNDPDVKKAAKKLKKLKELLKPFPLPESVTVEQAKEVMTDVVEAQTAAIVGTFEKVQKKLNINSKQELRAIMRDPSDPRVQEIQQALMTVDTGPAMKGILAKHDNLGTDRRVVSALSSKFSANPSFLEHIEKLNAKSKAKLQSLGLQMGGP